jgi:hypothetical protein
VLLAGFTPGLPEVFGVPVQPLNLSPPGVCFVVADADWLVLAAALTEALDDVLFEAAAESLPLPLSLPWPLSPAEVEVDAEAESDAEAEVETDVWSALFPCPGLSAAAADADTLVESFAA